MQTLERGYVNAGFVFFAVAILATAIFGRFFCGWACHIVALQDLCTWMLRKAGLRPRPFRSRLLVFVPFLAAVYMFIWPQIVRIWHGAAPPAWAAHFQTESFWATFPSWPVALLTFGVCGFLVVYLLGNKGFCTYACPYGGFFAPVDRLAPGRIRVTDACEGCGHCTAVCTSNVRVHEEVARHRMVVDSGCMKCMDCVDVCPKDALYFGFGVPDVLRPFGGDRSLARTRRDQTQTPRAPAGARPARHYDYSWPEEVALAGLFIASLYAWRGLYEAIPFLLALGLSAITAYLLLTAARVLYKPVRIHAFQLRLAAAPAGHSRITPTGRAYLAAAGLLVVFLAHSGFIQYHTREGTRLFEQIERSRAQAQPHAVDTGISYASTAGGSLRSASAPSAESTALARASLAHLQYASRWGVTSVANVEARMGALHAFLGQPGDAELPLRRAIARNPEHDAAHRTLSAILSQAGRTTEALEHLRTAVHLNPHAPDVVADLVNAYQSLNRPADLARELEALLEKDPELAEARLALGPACAQAGDFDRALLHTRRVIDQRPNLAAAHQNNAVILAEKGDFETAYESSSRATELDPDSVQIRLVAGKLAMLLRKPDAALEHLERARSRHGTNEEVLQAWAAAVDAAGKLREKIIALQATPADDLPSRLALAHLLAQSGDRAAAEAELSRLRDRFPVPASRSP